MATKKDLRTRKKSTMSLGKAKVRSMDSRLKAALNDSNEIYLAEEIKKYQQIPINVD